MVRNPETFEKVTSKFNRQIKFGRLSLIVSMICLDFIKDFKKQLTDHPPGSISGMNLQYRRCFGTDKKRCLVSAFYCIINKL